MVEAGSALFPDRTYVLTLPAPRKPPLTTDDVKVTENGKPVKNLAVLTSASSEGIGTVLLIDASNSMKNSIDGAMQAARAFAAQNPGQPLSVVSFNVKPTVALPLTTDRKAVEAVLAKPPKLAEGTRAFDALAAAVAQVRGSALGAARIVLLSDGDDVGSITTLDSAISQLQAQKIRVFTVGIESPDFVADDLQKIADKTGGTLRGGDLPGGADEDLRPARLRARERVPAPLPLRGAARPARRRSRSRSRGAEPVTFSYQTPSGGTSGPYKPAFRDTLLQSWLLIPLVVAAILGLLVLALRSLWSLRLEQDLVKRLGEFVTLPEEQRASERRKEVDALLAAVGAQKQRRRNWRWMEGFSEDVDVAQIDRDPTQAALDRRRRGPARSACSPACSSARSGSSSRSCPRSSSTSSSAGRRGNVRNDFAEQLPENLDVLASALRAGHSLAGAMGVVADEAPEPSKREYQPRRHRRAARHPARRGARGDGEAHAEHATSTSSPSSRSSSARRAATRRRCSTR